MKNICDWNNCNAIGEYKAPVAKDTSKKFPMIPLSLASLILLALVLIFFRFSDDDV